MASSVQVYLPSFGYTYTFTGVLSVKHEYSLKLQTDSSSASGEDYINGARNQPARVILTVVETDIGHAAGWANRMLQAMESIKRNRYLCTLVTCTPYGVNTHRLLVRGHRVENRPGLLTVTAEAIQIKPAVVAPVLAAPLLLILSVWALLRTGGEDGQEIMDRHRRQRNEKQA